MRNRKTGHLFQGRYKSIIIQNDAYLMRLSCYIHRNPLRAGLVERLIQYPWSSYPVYAYGKKGPDWLNTQVILSYFEGDQKHNRYREKVQHSAEEEKRLLEDLHHGMLLGAKKFVDKIRKQFLPDIPDDAIPQQKKLAGGLRFDEMVKKAATLLQIDMDACIQAKRLCGTVKHRRDLMMYLLRNQGVVTNEQVGRFFNISGSAVSYSVKAFQRKMKEDNNVKAQFDTINSQFKL